VLKDVVQKLACDQQRANEAENSRAAQLRDPRFQAFVVLSVHFVLLKYSVLKVFYLITQQRDPRLFIERKAGRRVFKGFGIAINALSYALGGLIKRI